MRLNFSSYNQGVAWLLVFHICVFAVFPLSDALAQEAADADVFIGTDDAVSAGEVQNNVNITALNVSPTGTTSDDVVGPTENSTEQSAAPIDVSVANENTAVV